MQRFRFSLALRAFLCLVLNFTVSICFGQNDAGKDHFLFTPVIVASLIAGVIIVAFFRVFGVVNTFRTIYKFIVGRLIWLPLIVITWIKSVYQLLVVFVAFPGLISLLLTLSQNNFPIVAQYITVCILFIILFWAIWAIQNEKFLQKFEKSDFYGASFPLMLYLSSGVAGVYCFASLTQILHNDHYLKITQRAGTVMNHETFINFYYWHVYNLIPQIAIPETFHSEVPFTYTDRTTPWLLLAFKIFVAYLIIRGVYKWFEWIRKKDHQEGYCIINRDKIYYELAGNGEFMVLIHGMAMDLKMWDSQFISFSKYYKVLRYDVRGFGQSSNAAYNWQYDHHNDLKRLFEHLEITTAHIVGFDMGARIAMDFTSAYPDKVSTLTLVSPFLHGYVPAGISLKDMNAIATKWGRKTANFSWLKNNFSQYFGNKSVSTAKKDISGKQDLITMCLKEIAEYLSLAKVLFTYSHKLIYQAFAYSGKYWVNTKQRSEGVPFELDKIRSIKAPILIFYGTKDSEEINQDVAAISEYVSSKHSRLIDLDAGHFLTLHYTIHSEKKEFDEYLLGILSFNRHKTSTIYNLEEGE